MWDVTQIPQLILYWFFLLNQKCRVSQASPKARDLNKLQKNLLFLAEKKENAECKWTSVFPNKFTSYCLIDRWAGLSVSHFVVKKVKDKKREKNDKMVVDQFRVHSLHLMWRLIKLVLF